MNRRFFILVGFAFLLIFGGALTSFIVAEGTGGLIPGVLIPTRVADGSVTQFGNNQGLYFVLMVGFILFNLVGATITGALIFWFLSREVTRAKAEEPANHETLGEALRLRRGDKNAGELTSGAES